jgi:nitronate monooxygenase
MREVGLMSPDVPDFPLAATAVMPLRRAAEAKGSGDFPPLWSGQAARLSAELPAGELTRHLAATARARLCDS